jgi:hypothetical protein
MSLPGTLEKTPKTPLPRGKEVTGFSVTATVENKPQLLRMIRPTGRNFQVPPELSVCAKFVLTYLFACFVEKGYIKEGLVDDFLYGAVGIKGNPSEKIAHGLVDLRRAGYISFVAQDNIEVDEHCSNLKDCWLRYNQKLLDLVEGTV